ncbi:MFS transporter, partial [Streptomyces sp. MCAF7]
FSMMSTLVFVLTLYFEETLGLSAFRTGLVFGVAGVLSAVAGAYASKVIGRFGARRTLVSSLVGQGVLTGALLGVNGDVWSVWLATAAISLACVCHLGVIVSYGLTVTSGVPNEEQGLATGLVTSTQQVGITIGIPLLGVLATTSSDLLTGLHTVLTVETVILLAAAVLVALGLRSRRTHPDAAVPTAAEVETLDAR